MKLLILVSCFLFTCFGVLAATSERLVSIETGAGSLAGTLLDVNNKNTNIIALIIAGSGPTDRNGNNPTMINNSLKMLAEELSVIGISSLRYDKRGVGKSKSVGLKENELRFEHYIDDANSWIEYLDNLNDYKKIIVIGHSEGALIGAVASQQKSVDKFVSIAGTGQPIDRTIRAQLQGQPAIVIEQATRILDELLQGKMVDNVPQYLNALFRPSVQPYMISWLKYDPVQEISQLNKPILIIQGTTDIQVTVNDANKLEEANSKTKKVIIDKMNHILKEAPLDRQANFRTYSLPDLPIKAELVQVIREFIID